MHQKINKDSCYTKIPAKFFEIFLIIRFLISIASLTANLLLTMWLFKFSYFLLFIEIGIIEFNFFNIIFFIILRIQRSNKSVVKNNYSSSFGFAVVTLILIIINILCSLTEEVLFYYVTPSLNKLCNNNIS